MEIKTREEAMELMAQFGATINLGDDKFSEACDALEAFFTTAEQREEMQDAEYKYALQLGIDPDFARFYYGRRYPDDQNQ